MDYTALTIRELKAEARGKVPGFSKMVKAQLIAELQAYDLAQVEFNQAIEDTMEETIDTVIERSTQQVIDRPTWADVISTIYLLVCVAIATAIYLGRKAAQGWQGTQTYRAALRAMLMRLYRWAEWEFAKAAGLAIQ